MEILLVIVGLGWLAYTILKEEVFTKPYPPNTDYRQINIDCNKYNLSSKEIDRRVHSGYYTKKDE